MHNIKIFWFIHWVTTNRYSGTPSYCYPCSASVHNSYWDFVLRNIFAIVLTIQRCANYAVVPDCEASETRHCVASMSERRWFCRWDYRHRWRPPNWSGCIDALDPHRVPLIFRHTNCERPPRLTSALCEPRGAHCRHRLCNRRRHDCRHPVACGGLRMAADYGDSLVVEIDSGDVFNWVKQITNLKVMSVMCLKNRHFACFAYSGVTIKYPLAVW